MENYKNIMFGNLLYQETIIFKPINFEEEEVIKKKFFNSANRSLVHELGYVNNFNKIETGYFENGIPFIILVGSNENIYLVSEDKIIKIPMIKSNDGKFYGKTWENKENGFVLGADEFSYVTENESITNFIHSREMSLHQDNGKLLNSLKFVDASEVFGQIPKYENYKEVNNLLSAGKKIIVTESTQAFYDDSMQKYVELYCLWDSIDSLEKNGKPMVIVGQMHFLEPNRKARRYISFVKNDNGNYEMIPPSNNVYCTPYSDYFEFETDIKNHGMRPAVGADSVSSICKVENEPNIISAIRTHVNLLIYCNKMNISINELNSNVNGISIQTNRNNNDKKRTY